MLLFKLIDKKHNVGNKENLENYKEIFLSNSE